MMAVDPTTVRMDAANRGRQVPHQRHRPGPRREDDRLGPQDRGLANGADGEGGSGVAGKEQIVVSFQCSVFSGGEHSEERMKVVQFHSRDGRLWRR